MTDQQPDLDAIQARAAHLYEYAILTDEPLQSTADLLTGTDVPALIETVRRLRARVTELERPAVEAQRNEIRSSYTALIAQAAQDRDHEGAFGLECQLREREAQWKAEDAAVPAAAGSAAANEDGQPTQTTNA